MEKIIKSRRWLPPLALICAILWALAYPFIKLGYAELSIAPDDLEGKILFAGIRFLSAGILVLLFAGKKHYKASQFTAKNCAWLFLFSLVNIALHYLFSYIGLGYTPSSRGTVIDSMNSFFLIILSCIFFADDRMSWNKVVGCILGFTGILIINVEPGKAMFNDVSFIGDGMILLNTLCGAFGGVLSRIVSRKVNMTVATGISMALGGAILCTVSVSMGIDKPWNLSLKGICIIIALILISAISFSIYNSLLAYHPISTVAIYNAFIPVFGVVFASLIIGEPFMWKYLIAGFCVAAGVFVINHRNEKSN